MFITSPKFGHHMDRGYHMDFVGPIVGGGITVYCPPNSTIHQNTPKVMLYIEGEERVRVHAKMTPYFAM